jgi:hypothetical protein
VFVSICRNYNRMPLDIIKHYSVSDSLTKHLHTCPEVIFIKHTTTAICIVSGVFRRNAGLTARAFLSFCDISTTKREASCLAFVRRHTSFLAFICKAKVKTVLLHHEGAWGRGGIAPAHSRPRH